MEEPKGPLVGRIRTALVGLTGSIRLRISVANDSIWESTKDGSRYLVRWMCWSIEVDGKERLAPEFAILGDHETRDKLAKELPLLFPDIDVVVDHDIEV